MTTGLRVRKRETGAKARLSQQGGATVESVTGGEMALVTAASAPGFNPVDLLHASLAGCLALSVRIAASELALFARFDAVEVIVSGQKAEVEFGRIDAMEAIIRISGDFTPEQRREIAERAERLCTISNTLRQPPRIAVALE